MAFLDPVLGWTLSLHPFLGIFILALLITLIINLIYKYTTDQKEMKRLKDKIDDFRKQIKASRDNPKKMMKLNQEAMEVNLQYMGKSLKPTLYTFIPIIFIFAWMNGHFTYAPLEAGQPLNVQAQFVGGFSGVANLTSPTLTTPQLSADVKTVDKDGTVAVFAVSGVEGKHDFAILYNAYSYNGSVWFGEKPETSEFPSPDKGPIKNIHVDYPRIHPLGPIKIFGWRPGWLAIYIILSIVLSISTRKLMKIY